MIIKHQLTIGERIVSERARLGFSQAAFAKKARVSRGTQFNYEIGKGSPTAIYLLAIRKLGADVGYILDGERTPPVISFYAVGVGRVLPLVADRLKLNWNALHSIIEIVAESEEARHALHTTASDEDVKLPELINALLRRGDLLDQVFREVEAALKLRHSVIHGEMRARIALLLFAEFADVGVVDPKIVAVTVKAAIL